MQPQTDAQLVETELAQLPIGQAIGRRHLSRMAQIGVLEQFAVSAVDIPGADEIDLTCPIPVLDYPRIVLAHGGGGRAMQRLIRELFMHAFASTQLQRAHDGAIIRPSGPIALTTDAFTVSPRQFPGGDLGNLAVHGTVNDLAMCGARPRWLSASLILEEGLELAELTALVQSMAAAARACAVEIVTGDTKVVERGAGDGVYITTTGVGELVGSASIGPERVRVGDAILVSGPIGDHGVAIMAVREQLEFEPPLYSDAGPVHETVLALLDGGIDVHCLRDPTRGGLASVLAEIAESSGLGMFVREPAIPIRETVADACELLGVDPLYVACEGRFVAFVPACDTARALALMRAYACVDASVIGEVREAPAQRSCSRPALEVSACSTCCRVSSSRASAEWLESRFIGRFAIVACSGCCGPHSASMA